MPNPDVFDPRSVDDMNREPERWHETSWDSVQHKIDHATFTQLQAIARGGIGEPESN